MASHTAPIVEQIQQEFQDLIGYVTGLETAKSTAYEVERTLFRRLLGLGLSLLRLFFLTRAAPRPRTVAHRNVVAALRAAHGDSIFATTIPDATVVEEAHLAQVGVVHWRPDSAVAQAYWALAQEVIARAQ